MNVYLREKGSSKSNFETHLTKLGLSKNCRMPIRMNRDNKLLLTPSAACLAITCPTCKR